MKSKYNSVVKVRKQQLDKAESNLNQAKQRQLEHEKAYELSLQEYGSLGVLPKSGSIAELRSNLSMAQVGREALARAKEKVELSKKEMNHYQFLYQKAHLDYEKMKVLEAEEIKQKQKELAKAEEKFLDEIAISRFFKGEKDD
ncbi:TPA: flagellar FliJ family protein [Campylobacter jejuni]|uniref:flagellar export protein FliJ n=1 Tax=Campylobacter jejuni TaxID=197 RepID=UPI0023510E22|nr:flagellar export protein FliJ [Campylobacter jejuni]MDC8064949.1 flagellar export protein FliJ [Campylobacter jejuni]MDC8080425.1 flagellar export protein FliJ [Campylobacter jejuni]HEC1045394.1 flagellar FliJ family protein [Campylobacter jejuni]HEC1066051.1 flagellar FliJ family protein [Campylobacter jejuni]